MPTKMFGQHCVTNFQNFSNLCIEHVQKHVQKHQIETVVSTLKFHFGYLAEIPKVSQTKQPQFGYP